MKNLITIIFLFFAISASAQDWQLKGTKYPNATNEGDTVSLQSRLPMLDENGLLNYYLPVADLLALNPAPVLEWGNITGTLSNQTDLQGALNDKADQSALTAHTSNGNIHFTQSAINITESQVSDLKDYLRGDINDTNGANKLTLGSLEVTGQTILQNGLNMSSVPVGTSDNILTLNQTTGDVEQRVFSLGDIDIANAAGATQFPVGLGEQLRFEGSGDTSISFNGTTNTVTITSIPGAGGGGAVTSFEGRDGAVVSQAGDYNTGEVNELGNLYFTEPRVRNTPLTGLTVTNTPISSTNTFLQALGRLQGQINDREVSFSKNTAFNKNFGTTAGTVAQGNDSRINNGQTAFSWGNHASAGYVPNTRTITAGSGLQGGGNLSSNRTISANFGTTSGTVLEGNWRPSYSDLTGTNPSYTKGESDGKYLLNTTDEFNGTLNINGAANITSYLNLSSSTSYGVSSGKQLLIGSDNETNVDNSRPYLYRFYTSGDNTGQSISLQRRLRGSSTFETIMDFNNQGAASFFKGISSLSTSSLGRNGFSGQYATSLYPDTSGAAVFHFVNPGGNILAIRQGSTAYPEIPNNIFELNTNGDLTLEGAIVAANFNGNGSGLTNVNADLLDGINSTGYAKMNTTNTGSITFTGDVIANSDKRLKTNIKRIDNALAIVQLLGGYEYDRKDVDLHQAGVIAQEVEEVFPVAVSEDANGTKSVAYNHLIALLIEAVKEQQIEIEELKTMINEK